MPSREAELLVNGAAPGISASTLVQTHALSMRAALVRRLLSAPLGGNRRALSSYTTRDFVVAVSPSVSTRPLGSVCVSSHTDPRRRRYSIRLSTRNRGREFAHSTSLETTIKRELLVNLLPRRHKYLQYL